MAHDVKRLKGKKIPEEKKKIYLGTRIHVGLERSTRRTETSKKAVLNPKEGIDLGNFGGEEARGGHNRVGGVRDVDPFDPSVLSAAGH